jgi:hypothetical protein
MAKISYKDVEVDPNEDLNIYNNICKILKECWFDTERFPTVEDVANAMGYTDRQITHLARYNNLPHRKDVVRINKMYASDKKSA